MCFEYQYHCRNCGRFRLSGTAKAMINSRVAQSQQYATRLSHLIRRMQRTDEWAVVTSHILDSVEKLELPDPATQLEDLILYIGTNQSHPGDYVEYRHDDLRAELGAFDRAGVHFIVSAAENDGLIDSNNTTGGAHSRLTMDGWRIFHELQRGSSKSPQAFMAMSFGNKILTTIFENYFKPAVKRAGFDLIRLDENPTAGSIDERLRVEIRRSSFLVADLSDDNAGAYWEAGFAEGLGKHVIYTCEESKFNSDGTHFDTNHFQTVLWSAESPELAADILTSTIRSTLPEDAKLVD